MFHNQETMRHHTELKRIDTIRQHLIMGCEDRFGLQPNIIPPPPSNPPKTHGLSTKVSITVI